ncbi:putative RNA-directed DNA polymerase, partial [Tanacetum coccineum]
LDEDIYMTQPEGFQSARKEENLVCKLKKSLCGLKQAPRQWYLKFDSFMQRAGYKRFAMDHCCYLKKVGSSSIILLLYVDDMLVAGSDMAEIKKLKRQLSQEFEMKDLGPTKQILGMLDLVIMDCGFVGVRLLFNFKNSKLIIELGYIPN